MINVLFFGQLRERLGQDSMTLEYKVDGQQLDTVKALRSYLQLKPGWHEWLEAGSVLVAVNQDMSAEDGAILDGAEVAFFPPVTGG